jgi:hypothetical protein
MSSHVIVTFEVFSHLICRNFLSLYFSPAFRYLTPFLHASSLILPFVPRFSPILFIHSSCLHSCASFLPLLYFKTVQVIIAQYMPLLPIPVAARSAAGRLLGLWVRIPPGAWMFVLYSVCVVR